METDEAQTMPVPTPAPPARWRWFRFSLRTLVIFVLLIGSGMGLWYERAPWVLVGSNWIQGAPAGRQAYSDGNVTLGPDSRALLRSEDGMTGLIYQYSGNSPSPTSSIPLIGHTAKLCSMSFSPDASLVITSADDGTARVWDGYSGAVKCVLRGHDGAVNAASFSNDGTLITTAGQDGTARIWDATSGLALAVYAKRTNLPPTKTLDLGNNVNLELVLIPAGKFVMGTPEPVPVDEDGFRKKIIVGQAAFAVGVGVLLVLIGTVIIRAVRQRHRPQYSLARFMVMTVVAGVAVMGGMHWWQSSKALAQAQTDYAAALPRYEISGDREKPAHEVTLTKPWYMGKYEVTQEQYQQGTGTNPSHFKGANLPVEMVLWDDAQAFCKKLNEKTGQVVRLPTEAEWEFACRAGTITAFYTGDGEADLGRVAWYYLNCKNTTHPVGQKEPNAWGLYDMHGNVQEWCQDYWQDQYELGAVVDPQGPPEGKFRVSRGGSWGSCAPWYCRSAYRDENIPDDRLCGIGFRIVVEVPKTP